MATVEHIRLLKPELDTIKDTNIKDITILALSCVDKQFFKAPASSTGKYHPMYALGDGGLLRHTKAAVYFCNELLALEQYQNQFTELEQDLMRSALILHDTCKCGTLWENEVTVHEHPLIVEGLLHDEELCQNDKDLWTLINRLIQTHMGQWVTHKQSSTELPKPKSQTQKFVHMCDYLASRKNIELAQFKGEGAETREPSYTQHNWEDDDATEKQIKKLEYLLQGAKSMGALPETEIYSIETNLTGTSIKKGWASKMIEYLIPIVDKAEAEYELYTKSSNKQLKKEGNK